MNKFQGANVVIDENLGIVTVQWGPYTNTYSISEFNILTQENGS
jgi:hypothetical protein